MTSMILSVGCKATFGMLRKLAAEKLKEGDVVDAKLRDVIVDKIDNINTKLDALAGKGLAASMSFFRDGLVYLEKVLNERMTDREKPEKDKGATQAVGAVVGIMEEECLGEKIKNLQLANLNDAARKNLEMARKRFEKAHDKAVAAFGNAALSTPDRLLAMAIRIMAALLEQVEDLTNALASCKLCLKELHSLSVVQENFRVQLQKGFKSKFGQDKRTEIILAVCQMNRVVYDVTQMVDEGVSKARELLIWPCVDVGEERIDPLRDSRIARKLPKLDMEQFCVQPWSFGQEGEEEHRLESVKGIAINTKGQFIIADDKNVKVFDSRGKFLKSFSPDNGRIEDVATDGDDNMYVLVQTGAVTLRDGGDVYVFDTQAKLHHSFRITPGYIPFSLVVDVSEQVLVSVTKVPGPYGLAEQVMVEIYENRGRRLQRIELRFWNPNHCLISTTGDGHLMVLDIGASTFQLFSPQEDYHHRFGSQVDYLREEEDLFPRRRYRFSSREDNSLEKKVQLRQPSPKDHPVAMTFHQASEQLFITSVNAESGAYTRQVSLYKKDGEFVRSIPLDLQGRHYTINGIVATNNGQIALAVREYFWEDDDKLQDNHIILIV